MGGKYFRNSGAREWSLGHSDLAKGFLCTGSTTYNPSCDVIEKMSSTRKECVESREQNKEFRGKIGNGISIIGAYAALAGWEVTGAILVLIDIQSLIGSTMRCPGDTGPLL
ncbi:hypothetical protein AYB33_17375 [Leptospira santarosai]|nr:hypothetical protein AYB33_17375 [Leptospira santarosai]